MAASKILEQLSCAICLEPFTEPVTLPCLHSFCKQCVASIHRSRRSPETLNCPECRKDVVLGDQGIDGLPRNFTIATLVDSCKEQETPKPPKQCSVCEIDPPRIAVKTCHQCDISYCDQCVKVMHPNRGAFATHELVDEAVEEGPTSAKVARTEEINPNLDGDSKFCPACNRIITPSKYIAHQRLGHDTIDMKNAATQKLARIKVCLQQLEKFKQDITMSITKSEGSLEQITEQGKQQVHGISRCLERVKEMIMERERQLGILVKREVVTATTLQQQQVQEKQRFYANLDDTYKIGADLVENGGGDKEDSDVVQISLEIEQRLSEFEAEVADKIVDHSNNIPGEAHTQMKALESRIQDLLDGKTENNATNTNISKETKLTVESAKPLWKYAEGCIDVKWKRGIGLQGKMIDLKLCRQNRIITLTNVDERVKVDKLEQGVSYVLTLYVQGCPEIESEPVTVQTLEDIVGKGILFDSQSSSRDVNVSVNGKALMHFRNSNIGVPALIGIVGTMSTRTVSNIYWETKLKFSLRRLARDGETAFEIGICDSSKVDHWALFRNNSYAYICNVAKRFNGEFIEFESEGQSTPRDTRVMLPPVEVLSLSLGFYLNSNKNTFSVINTTEGRILYTFTQVRRCDSYLAVFGLGEGEERTDIRVDLIAGRDLKTIPEVVHEQII